MSLSPIPPGHHTVTPCLVVENAAALIDFLKAAFGAQEVERYDGPDGKVLHAEVRIPAPPGETGRDAMLMIGEAMPPEYPATPSRLCLFVADTDATYAAALRAGATSIKPPADQFYGHRAANVKDPTGNVWWISTRTEDLTPEEINRRMAAQGSSC